MLVAVLSPSVKNEERSEKCDAVDVAKEDGGAGVQAEGADGAEGRHEADVESKHVRESGDGDRNGRLFVRIGKASLYLIVNIRLLPTGNEDEHVVHSDPYLKHIRKSLFNLIIYINMVQNWFYSDASKLLPNIRNGELATVMTNGTPMCNIIPKEDRTASPAENTPNVATHTLFLTQSNLEKETK